MYRLYLFTLILYCSYCIATANSKPDSPVVTVDEVETAAAGDDSKDELVPTNDVSTDDNDNEELINELKKDVAGGKNDKEIAPDDDDDVEAAYSLRRFVRFSPYVLRRYINALVTQRLAHEPVTKMLYLSINPHRTLSLYRLSGYTLKPTLVTSINIRNYNRNVGNSLLAYRPLYRDYHSSKIAGIFVNIRRLFPCLSRTGYRRPICRMFTNEEDGFNHGRTLVEAGDGGNNFRMFGSSYASYGFGFASCPTLSPHCLPSWYQTTIVCQLPRAYCR